VVVTVVVVAAVTMTVPVMFECTRQWYENRPACDVDVTAFCHRTLDRSNRRRG
jgi:hypothetical protein